VNHSKEPVESLGEQPLGRSCLARHGQSSAAWRPVITLAGWRNSSANASWIRTLPRSRQYGGLALCDLRIRWHPGAYNRQLPRLPARIRLVTMRYKCPCEDCPPTDVSPDEITALEDLAPMSVCGGRCNKEHPTHDFKRVS
jgi:hypothetical protein